MAKTMKTMDGNMAAAHVSYAFTEVAAIYPITPSSPMAEYTDEWAAHGQKNIFGEPVKLVEMQSEAGASGAVHGSLQAGALTTTYTASQGLLLMIPNMYKIAGELLPSVFHVSARTLATHALSIFGDHSDVYATRQTGFAMLASSSVQEVMDLGAVAHLAAIKTRIPFLHFFDGFRTSHEIQKIETLDYDDLAKLVDYDAIQKFKDNALNPEHPVTRGTAQNPDIFFQAREACNSFYDKTPDVVAKYMEEISALTGREYKPFVYYGAADAENIIIAMGSVTDTIKDTIDYLNSKGKKVGLIIVHLYRPFSEKYFFNVLPKSVKRIAVLDRTKEAGASGEPLELDIKSIFYGKENAPIIVGGRYGLSSKDTTPTQIISVYENLEQPAPKDHFTIGIVDDVTFHSLPLKEKEVSVVSDDTKECLFYGLGSDGTVGANKNSIKIIGDHTEMYAQGYFSYDSKKSGGLTVSHLRFGNSKLRCPYLINAANFVACSQISYLDKYDMLKGLRQNGIFLLNSIWDKNEIIEKLPNKMKRQLAQANAKFYIVNATKIAQEIGMPGRTNTILQAGFFKLSEVIPYEKAVEYMKAAIKKSYGKKGEDIVNKNFAAVDRGTQDLIEVPVDPAWADLTDDEKTVDSNRPDFIKNVCDEINAQNGDNLPVSAFVEKEDGTFPPGTTAFEKRGIAVNIPQWNAEYCIQCNQCAYVCPHAAIRPFLLNEEEVANLPTGTETIDANGKALAGLKFRIQVSPLDCTGCGNCVNVCPAVKGKALELKPLETQEKQKENWEYMHHQVGYKDTLMDKNSNVKASQFAQPLFEFSGACAGCGETPYIKLITQLFGDRMLVANATGCSSIYGGSAPATPYCPNKQGKGPAWANSLFEDNAEYGLGMKIAIDQMQARIKMLMETAIAEDSANSEAKAACEEWLANYQDAELSKEASAKVEIALAKESANYAKQILALKQYLIKKSVWIFGGDGWAYDIGYGGVDHVLATGENVNILVVDTEVYSNTGGQSSKATPVAAVAKFAASGKKIRKKDLGMMAMSYGYVYVAQVAMGASQAQYLKVLREAEAYDGPSLIIAYAPCINHGLRAGMGKSQAEEKNAVESGYWHLYHYNPLLEKEGKNPFILDSKDPDWDKFQDFIKGEVRYTSLQRSFPETAEELFKAAQENAKWRYDTYKRRAAIEY